MDSDVQPCIVASAESHMATYRHLGAKFNMNVDIEGEVFSQIGICSSGVPAGDAGHFSQSMSCFERAHSAVGSLITTRVLYGCSVWTDAPTALLKKVEALIIDHHCGTPQYWILERATDDYFGRGIVDWPIFSTLPSMALFSIVIFYSQEFSQGRGWLREVLADHVGCNLWLTFFLNSPSLLTTGSRGGLF